jgi:hypothetical protein
VPRLMRCLHAYTYTHAAPCAVLFRSGVELLALTTVPRVSDSFEAGIGPWWVVGLRGMLSNNTLLTAHCGCWWCTGRGASTHDSGRHYYKEQCCRWIAELGTM